MHSHSEFDRKNKDFSSSLRSHLFDAHTQSAQQQTHDDRLHFTRINSKTYQRSQQKRHRQVFTLIDSQWFSSLLLLALEDSGVPHIEWSIRLKVSSALFLAEPACARLIVRLPRARESPVESIKIMAQQSRFFISHSLSLASAQIPSKKPIDDQSHTQIRI